VLAKGTTFIRSGHIWFNLTEPTRHSPLVLCVNLTTLDDECPDDECLIESSEYSWVEDGHPTTIAFSRARIWDAEKIESCLADGKLKKPHDGDISKSTLNKILKIALKSGQLNCDFKKFL
jgi:hypothetical protein